MPSLARPAHQPRACYWTSSSASALSHRLMVACAFGRWWMALPLPWWTTTTTTTTPAESFPQRAEEGAAAADWIDRRSSLPWLDSVSGVVRRGVVYQ